MSKTTNKFAPEVGEPAARMVVDHESDYPVPLSGGGIGNAEDRLRSADLHGWANKADVDGGKRAGGPSEVAGK